MSTDSKPIRVQVVRTATGKLHSRGVAGAAFEKVAAPIGVLEMINHHDTLAPDPYPLQTDSDPQGRLRIDHQLSLGSSPQLFVQWNVDEAWYRRRYRVMLFRSTSGFANSTSLTPLDRLDHGRLLIETRSNGNDTLLLDEGENHITALLLTDRPHSLLDAGIARVRLKLFGSPMHVAAETKFRVSVPNSLLATQRVTAMTELLSQVVRNARLRERAARQTGTIDDEFVVDRRRKNVARDTAMMLAEWSGIRDTFDVEIARIEARTDLTADQKRRRVKELRRVLRDRLNFAQYPQADPHDEAPRDVNGRAQRGVVDDET